MVDLQKEASSSVDLKEKTSLLDEEIGKEFFSSWKSMSVTEDDAMDFQFETVTKGNKKAFNFEKLDMDFSLGGDFDKISSFKVDMPDLDFSCAPKKNEKEMEISERSGKYQAKQDHLSFSFDFNDFNFDSSLKKGKEKSKKCHDSKGITPEKSENQGSRNHLSEDTSAFDNSITELPPLESSVTFKAETSVGGLENIDSRNDNCPSNSETIANLGVSHGDKTLAKNTMTTGAEEVDRQCHPSEETVSTEPHVMQTIHTLPVQCASENDSIQDTITKPHTQVCLPDTANANSGGERIAQAKIASGLGPNCENLLLKKSPSPPLSGPERRQGENNRMSSNNHVPLGNTDGTELVESDLDLEAASCASVSKNTPHNKTDQEIHNSTSKLLLSSLNSDKQTEEKGTGVVRSKFFKRLETECQLRQLSPTSSNIISHGRTRIGTMHLNPPDARRDEIKSDAAKLGSKAVARSNTEELTECDPTLLGSEKYVKDLGSTGFHGSGSSLTRQTTTAISQDCVNSKLVVSSMETLRNSIISSVKRTQSSSLRAPKRTTDLSSLKISRTASVNNDSSSSTCQKQSMSLQDPEPRKEVQGNVALETVYSDGPRKQAPSPSSKRKTFEETNVDILALNPPKRLSGSPNESREITGPSELLNDTQVCDNSNMVDSTIKNADLDCPKSAWDFPVEASMIEVEFPSAMENDGNVGKAEACSKELEDICNMLKKKHDEAKELLVRAIINNNNLLMLNHPIYDEKFQRVQKFAAKLMSKELQTTN